MIFWHIFILASFAIAQPIFEILSKNSSFFAIKRSTPLELLFLTVILLLLVPLTITVLSRILGQISAKIKYIFSFFSFTLLAALISSPILKIFFTVNGILVICISVLIGLIFSYLYFRKSGLRSFITLLSPAFFIFPALFIINADISKILFPSKSFNGSSSPASSMAREIPIVMVIFDELPLISLLNDSQQIDKIRFPGFGSLSENSNWYKNASCLSSWTEHAVPIIMSGRESTSSSDMPTLKDYPQNIFTLLAGSHEINAYEQVTHLCPDSICTNRTDDKSFKDKMVSLLSDVGVIYAHIILPDDLKGSLPNIDVSWGDFLGDRPQSKKFKQNKKGLLDKGGWADDEWLFNKFLNSLHDSEKAELNLIHITFPHVPYRYLPSGKKYLKNLDRLNDKGYKKQWGPEEWPTIQQYQRYMLQLGFADKMMANLVEKLKTTGLYEKSLIVVTADHGTSFQPNEYSRRVSNKNYMDILPIPLLVKFPDQTEPKVIDKNVGTVDILPTIADYLGISPNVPFDGTSALKSDTPEKTQKTFYTLDVGKNEKLTFESKIDFTSALHRKLKLFGSNSPIESVFKISPLPEKYPISLIGEPVEELKNRKKINVKLDSSEDFNKVNKTTNYIPSFISADLEDSPEKQEINIAVSVNGIIRGLTQSYETAKRGREFFAMVPEESFHDGSNNVEVWELE